jgi:cell wall-associated NlpC family hydrolase
VTATPGTAELARNAVGWALAHLGDRAYALRCLAFVEDAYERSNRIELFGGSSAAESAAAYGTKPYDPQAPPPRGAFVFYACSGPADGRTVAWGHVGLALGEGRVIHAWDRVRIDDARAVPNLTPRAGWTPPTLLGWTPPSRLLRGHQLREWDAVAGV